MLTNIQLVSHGTPQSHSPPINIENIDAAINISYGFGSSPIGVRTILFNYGQLYLHIYSIDCNIQYILILILHVLCRVIRMSILYLSLFPLMQR